MKRVVALAVVALSCVTANAATAAPALVAPTPAKWKCKPFRNAALVVAFARKRLVYNGFRPNIEFTCGKGSIMLFGILDGAAYQGAIEKTGPRRIRIGIVEHPPYPPGRALYTDSATFTVLFDA